VNIQQLVEIMPRSASVAAGFVGPLNQAMARWNIADSQARVEAFLAQAAHESGELMQLRENLNYSPGALLKTWPTRFTPETAATYARRPGAIASKVYANRLGNGDEMSGDGWTFLGRGIFQLTGRANYREASLAICGDPDTLVDSPDLVQQPEYACETAGWFWNSKKLNRFADMADFEGLTRAINGGFNGLDARVAYWHRAIEAFS
jgi:putative chitinase